MRCILVWILFFCASLMSYADKPRILVTVKPLAMMMQSIAGDKIFIEQLLPDQASHHDYPMKMSDYVKLQQADLVIWIGPELESFLVRPLTKIPANRQTSLMMLADLTWPEVGHVLDDHRHSRDPHLWLNPLNMIKVVQSITPQLISLDAENQAFYQAKEQLFIEQMKQLDEKIALQMVKLKGKGFAVYHQAYGHFVGRYGLTQLGFITLTPERKSGAKHLAKLYQQLDESGHCVFAEPLMDRKKMEALANKHQLRVGYLDIMGINAQSYTELMLNLAESFSACLANGRG